MFPNPQDALPLPPRPAVEQYEKLADELVSACRSADPDAIEAWADRFWRALSQADTDDPAVTLVARFAERTLKSADRECGLADAQLVLARSHGFATWPKLVAHLDALGRVRSDTADFEAATDAIVAGDADSLRRLLREKPELVRSRSSREHGATLLHYVAANGVENFRQRTPQNIVEIARILLDAGAEVDAEANVYGGGCTALGLVATSVHPLEAGVQNPLMQVLLDRGARIEQPNSAGNGQSLVLACLANGRPGAAEYLAERGATLDLESAAGVGRLDVVARSFDEDGALRPSETRARLDSAFRCACGAGRRDVVAFLLDRGAALDAAGSDGQSPLHCAVIGGSLDVVRFLLARKAPIDARNAYGGTPLGQALWSAALGGHPDDYVAIVEALIAAGSEVPARHPPIHPRIDALLAGHGAVADPERFWYGEEPRRKT